ncbi:hypothetical protein [Vreelandella lionensis]|uniref:hypothetical protein n=1 Tax=Vreelandella lionensis TaxID=1144478 RepID=UPI0009F20ED4|nr:hypothetical protein [Halomonas lionensis]
MSAALDELLEANARYAAVDTGLAPCKRQQRIDALAAEDQMIDDEIILKRFFYSPVGIQELDHLLSCWRPGKGRGWTDQRVIASLDRLIAAGLIAEGTCLSGKQYELTKLAYRHFSGQGRKGA